MPEVSDCHDKRDLNVEISLLNVPDADRQE